MEPVFLALAILLVILTIAFHNSRNKLTATDTIMQEMGWLLGDDWQAKAEPQHYLFAQQRIYRRQNNQAIGVLYGALFLLISLTFFVPSGLHLIYQGSVSERELVVFVGYLLISVRLLLYWFPTLGMLRRREQAIGQKMDEQLRFLPSFDKLKNAEKPKRGMVRLSDDGELIDVPDESEAMADAQTQHNKLLG